MARVEGTNMPINISYILQQFLVFTGCCFTILTLSFIISKNKLTKKNNYDILIYGLFFLMFINTTVNTDVLLSNFFVLLALRRVMSLHSKKNIKSKLFDAGFWIAIAALFYFWSILFFLLIPISLFLYQDNNFRHWLIPFVGVAAVFVIAVALSVVVYNDFFTIFNAYPAVSFDFSVYNSTRYLVAITLLFSFGIWALFFYINSIKKKERTSRASLKIIVAATCISFLIIVISPLKSGSEFLFSFAPLTIIITNYVEVIEEKWFKNLFLWIMAVVPFVLLLL
ncbi:MAG: DUF6427 family protein [Flavobacteriaceae bacterium]